MVARPAHRGNDGGQSPPRCRVGRVHGGAYGGGHGHPDRLHLTLHAGGVHWLADPGTGSYVTPDLLWYRSTLAHNAPRVDGEDQPIELPTLDGKLLPAGRRQSVIARTTIVVRRAPLGPHPTVLQQALQSWVQGTLPHL